MGYTTLELTLISAKNLKDVNLIGKMDVYVVVSLSGCPKSKQKTHVHQDGGTNPQWNHTMRFTIDEAAAAQSGWMVVFQLKHDAIGPDKNVGEVRVPVRELIDGFRGKKDAQFVTYQVRRPSGKPHGELKFSYKLADQPHAPVAAYPPQACGSSAAYAQPATAYAPPPTAYPPPPVGYPPAQGYPPQGYPPQAPYGGYPPVQQPGYGYGYAPPPAAAAPGGYPVQGQYGQKPKKNGGFGMGMGAGLIGGAIGGLLLGEVVSDVCEDGFDL